MIKNTSVSPSFTTELSQKSKKKTKKKTGHTHTVHNVVSIHTNIHICKYTKTITSARGVIMAFLEIWNRIKIYKNKGGKAKSKVVCVDEEVHLLCDALATL